MVDTELEVLDSYYVEDAELEITVYKDFVRFFGDWCEYWMDVSNPDDIKQIIRLLNSFLARRLAKELLNNET